MSAWKQEIANALMGYADEQQKPHNGLMRLAAFYDQGPSMTFGAQAGYDTDEMAKALTRPHGPTIMKPDGGVPHVYSQTPYKDVPSWIDPKRPAFGPMEEDQWNLHWFFRDVGVPQKNPPPPLWDRNGKWIKR